MEQDIEFYTLSLKFRLMLFVTVNPKYFINSITTDLTGKLWYEESDCLEMNSKSSANCYKWSNSAGVWNNRRDIWEWTPQEQFLPLDVRKHPSKVL